MLLILTVCVVSEHQGSSATGELSETMRLYPRIDCQIPHRANVSSVQRIQTHTILTVHIGISRLEQMEIMAWSKLVCTASDYVCGVFGLVSLVLFAPAMTSILLLVPHGGGIWLRSGSVLVDPAYKDVTRFGRRSQFNCDEFTD
jgi:hypothetical protein